ncbi:Cytochrome b subunit OS=Streptomyces glaucescens OX=1907 GN=SGLAU_29305 PE=4 SV=1 [Streptomyces glaucescens]
MHKKPRASYATRRPYVGRDHPRPVHRLARPGPDLHPGGFQEGHPYENVVDTFSTWYGNVIYIVAMLAVGLAARALWSAAQDPRRRQPHPRPRPLKPSPLALLLAPGPSAVPVGVMTGVVS